MYYALVPLLGMTWKLDCRFERTETGVGGLKPKTLVPRARKHTKDYFFLCNNLLFLLRIKRDYG